MAEVRKVNLAIGAHLEKYRAAKCEQLGLRLIGPRQQLQFNVRDASSCWLPCLRPSPCLERWQPEAARQTSDWL